MTDGSMTTTKLRPIVTSGQWIGPPDRPLMAWLTRPAQGIGDVGVVIVPPVGYEYWSSHRTLRTLAERLAENGCLALRFDFDGTGDSGGDQWDPARLEAWRSEYRTSRGRPARVGRHQAGRHRAALRRHARPDAGRGGRGRCGRRLGAGRPGEPLRQGAAVARVLPCPNRLIFRRGPASCRRASSSRRRRWPDSVPSTWEPCRIVPPRRCWLSTGTTSRQAPRFSIASARSGSSRTMSWAHGRGPVPRPPDRVRDRAG